MGRVLGVVCSSDAVLLAVADGAKILTGVPEKLTTAGILEENARLGAMRSEFQRVLTEVQPQEVRILRPEQTYKDSYTRIAPRVALETVVRIACVEAQIPVEVLKPASARARLGLPRSGALKSHVPKICDQVGKYWSAGRNLAAVAALAGDQ